MAGTTSSSTGPTLTDMTYIGRKVVKFGVIALVALIVGRFLLTAFVNYWRAVNPPPPPPPTVGFGILPPIEFPTSQDGVTSYQLETATGGLPTFGDRAKVFFMPKSNLGLLSDERARQVAQEFNFLFAPEVLDSTTYRWTKTQPLDSTLEMDISNLNFMLDTDFLSRPELLSNTTLPDGAQAGARVKSMLRSANLLPADVATATADTVYMRALGGDLQPAVSFSDADFVEVNLNRNPIDGQFRMFTPNGLQGVIRGIVSGAFGSSNDSVVQLSNDYQEVDYTQMHTYPLRSVETAWNLLQSGEGFIANPGNGSTAVIRNVQLGYFDSFDPQTYLQPIYVFEGDGGFLGYVPAIDPRYVQSTSGNGL